MTDFAAGQTVMLRTLFVSSKDQSAKIVITEASGRVRVLFVPVASLEAARPAPEVLTPEEEEYRTWQYMERGP